MTKNNTEQNQAFRNFLKTYVVKPPNNHHQVSNE